MRLGGTSGLVQGQTMHPGWDRACPRPFSCISSSMPLFPIIRLCGKRGGELADEQELCTKAG